mmetsp:Transcript_26145/g.60972  ORF Transcript_26145/g.60972 Transcript_26145/m.60972 type:complete len:397 (-) Transcript_26145:28-1218(-)
MLCLLAARPASSVQAGYISGGSSLPRRNAEVTVTSASPASASAVPRWHRSSKRLLGASCAAAVALSTSSSRRKQPTSAVSRKAPGAAAAAKEERKEKCVAVVIPGLLYDSSSMEPLAKALEEEGIAAAIVPIEWWHWLPCLGGRSMRPVLERINFAVAHVLRRGVDVPMPEPEYSFADFLTDFMQNPGGVLKVGGSTNPDEYPKVDPQGQDFQALRKSGFGDVEGKVALVGHSAGGWIARIFSSDSVYGGFAYKGSPWVHSIVSLGSPHAPAPGVAYSSLEWLARQGNDSSGVRFLAVGSGGILASDNGFSRSAYVFCGADEKDDAVDGDGVTTLESALAVEGAEKLRLQGVAHAPSYPSIGPSAELAKKRSDGQPWYGSVKIVKQWAPWLLEVRE